MAESMYKFMKTSNGITAFSIIKLDSEDNVTWSIEWEDTSSYMRSRYESAVSQGVEIAKDAYLRLGGKPQKINIKLISDTVSGSCCKSVEFYYFCVFLFYKLIMNNDETYTRYPMSSL